MPGDDKGLRETPSPAEPGQSAAVPGLMTVHEVDLLPGDDVGKRPSERAAMALPALPGDDVLQVGTAQLGVARLRLATFPVDSCRTG